MIYKSREEETDTKGHATGNQDVIKDTKVLKGLYSQGTNQSARRHEGPSNSSHTFFPGSHWYEVNLLQQ